MPIKTLMDELPLDEGCDLYLSILPDDLIHHRPIGRCGCWLVMDTDGYFVLLDSREPEMVYGIYYDKEELLADLEEIGKEKTMEHFEEYLPDAPESEFGWIGKEC